MTVEPYGKFEELEYDDLNTTSEINRVERYQILNTIAYETKWAETETSGSEYNMGVQVVGDSYVGYIEVNIGGIPEDDIFCRYVEKNGYTTLRMGAEYDFYISEAERSRESLICETSKGAYGKYQIMVFKISPWANPIQAKIVNGLLRVEFNLDAFKDMTAAEIKSAQSVRSLL